MEKPKKKLIFSAAYWIIGLLLILVLPQLWLHFQTKEISYSTFKSLVKEGRVLGVQVEPDEIKGIYFNGPEKELKVAREEFRRILRQLQEQPPSFFSQQQGATLQDLLAQLKKILPKENITLFRTVRVDDPKLTEFLDQYGVEYAGVREGFVSQLFWGTIIPILFWIGLWFLLIRGMGRPGAGMLGFGKSKAKIAMEKDTGVTFDDVAGCEEAKQELQEVVAFLKEPEKYERLGAKIPKGVLLVGPPGTGKTLMARALAGEAKVPFFSISGSEFVEMFVGVGAARVRDLFEHAKKAAPCIIFIDEIDAIGKFRGGGFVSGGNEEREQTLNQLLVEMDGFEPNTGVIILAATNRPEVLDPALLRPGRFDRQIVLDVPDVHGREAILKVHARGKPLADDVDLRSIALRTPGFSGADLANVMNEAALLAAREGKDKITQAHLEAAVERVLAGPERRSRRLGEKERKRVAYHEAGHAVVAYYSPNAAPVSKISIIPRGKAALGYTLQLPEEEHYLMTKSELLDRICVALGGRASEKIFLGETSSGAQNDLEIATEMARSMITRFGMSDVVGPIALSRETSPFLNVPGFAQHQEPLSPELASLVDKEVKKVLTEQDIRAREILLKHKSALKRVAEQLLKVEVMNADEFKQLVEMDEEKPEGGMQNGE